MEVVACINKLVETSRYNNMSLNDSRSPLFSPYSFLNISCGKEERDDVQCGWKNIVEVAVVTRIVKNLYKGISLHASLCWTRIFYMHRDLSFINTCMIGDSLSLSFKKFRLDQYYFFFISS